MQIPQQISPCDVYIPEQDATRMKKIAIMSRSQPDAICGVARRIGYTGISHESIAIYRLKVLSDGKLITLPLPFIIEDGVFVEYEQWNHNRKIEQP